MKISYLCGKRKKYYKYIILIIGIYSSNIYAEWSTVKDGDLTKYYWDNNLLIKEINIPHVPQPTKNTCGATNLRTLFSWATKTQGTKEVNYNIKSIYDYVNTNGEDGIQVPELIKGIENLKNYTNKAYKMNLSMGATELKSSTIKGGIEFFSFLSLSDNPAPAILYGNTKYGGAGGHYYSAFGALQCPPSLCGGTGRSALKINDSVYNSPAYGSVVRGDAIIPSKFVFEPALKEYWKKTGANVLQAWKRKHIMLLINIK